MGSIAPPANPPQFLIIGAGSRGHAYARAVEASTSGRVAALAEIDPFKRQEFGKRYIWGREGTPAEHECFDGWEEWVDWESRRRQNTDKAGGSEPSYIPITGVFICTLDETHAPIIRAIADFNLHILCEKPLALSLSDCVSISSSLSQYPRKVFSIGHVLRYSPHNILLRKLLTSDQVIGEVVSIEHTEPVGWWHFSHSYARKPKAAGTATNCLSCSAEPVCNYSAKKIYRGRWLRKEKDTGWPLKIVVPEIEDIVAGQGWDAAEKRLMDRLSEDYDRQTTPDDLIASRGWYGRCVFDSDNDVVDDQTVTMEWDDEPLRDQEIGRGPKRALFHMTYPTQAQCERRGWIYGTEGEIHYDSHKISVHTFATGTTIVHDIPKQAPEVEKSHGGGDWGLAGAFVQAVQKVDEGTMDVAEAQRQYVGDDLDEIILSHAAVFAAEEARREKKVVHWADWWNRNGTTTA
ncbi:hypothetical protein LTR10_014102 [Elasticomyces elasticus]|nr:hypothetical protein LTR10_014102 [Elasticomyces elasticus]KAK5026508.1 hypothetical protein LTS07_007442 [Exophiala sideris]KAK5180043.1 hypothetical protein LTR44_007519 [Eurotiomycetes sp. CCFEE 6388]